MRYAPLLLVLLAGSLSAADRPDILVADFEGESYADGWKATGTAFGKGPAKGTLPNQMPVSGYLGKGLVNSYLGGDAATGTLASPEFKLERKHINFLIGGGKHAKTCVNLLVGGKVVRTATGPNDKPGGTEALDWHTWDVAEYEGKAAVIQIVDEEKGGWGHINVDHIVMSDAKKQAKLVQHVIGVGLPYLHLPVKNGAPKRRVRIVVNKETAREFDIELATDGKPDFWATTDVSAFKTFTAEVLLPADVKDADVFQVSDRWRGEDALYTEKHRPLFHFTSRTGWLNDPNGLVYANGEWHLFYQHNPFGREWGNMHWGHATSTDLFRWKEQGVALYPKKYGDWAFSGSAVLDKENTSGWGTKDKPALVLAYTSTGRGECIAYSNDNGKTWTEYDKNPVVKHVGRDPKLIWHEKAKHWVMAVYTEADKKQWIAFHTSPDLKTWTYASRIEGFFECPDLFPMPTKVENAEWTWEKWVLYAADGKYLVGTFDGKEFKPDFKEKKQLWYGRFYAAQSFDNAPDMKWGVNFGVLPPRHERRVQIGWAQGVSFPGTPFNQQMTVPVELRLRDDGDGPRLVGEPVAELAGLREKEPVRGTERPALGVAVKGGEHRSPLADNLDAFEVIAELSPDKATSVGFDLRGTKLRYDVAKQTLTCKDVSVPVKLRDGKLSLRILVDRGSVEVFVDGGRVAMSVAALPDEKNDTLELVGNGRLGTNEVTVYRLKSAWGK